MCRYGLLISFFLIFLLSPGCRWFERPAINPGQEPEKVVIYPYGRDLFALDPLNIKPGLDTLVEKYSFFLGEDPDTLAILQIRDFIMDPFNRQLATDCMLKYKDDGYLATELDILFRNCQANIPGFRPPAVYSYVSGLLYESPVQYIDSILVIGLDMFLGRDYELYRAAGLPVYMTRRMEKENIVPESARQIALSKLPAGADPRNLLDYMILEGKVFYAMGLLLPGTPDSLITGYTTGQSEWCRNNEKKLWQLMIDQELLYSADPLVIRKFIQDGPFTAGMPEGAPAMLGKWIGWQIVRSYMEKNDRVSLEQLFNTADSQEILSRSGYKPKK